MDDAVAKAIAHTITRIVVDLPLALLIIRLWVWAKLPEWFDLPTPSWKQTWGIAIVLLTITG